MAERIRMQRCWKLETGECEDKAGRAKTELPPASHPIEPSSDVVSVPAKVHIGTSRRGLLENCLVFSILNSEAALEAAMGRFW